MDPRTPAGEERSPCRFSASLSSAVSEWILIFLLFINGYFSYLVTKFACYCKLQIPCIFCSRFDHVLDHSSPDFYDNLICTSHKLEISSKAYCHIHQKLADVGETCEPCLLSFANMKQSSSKSYRSLVGKLEINYHDGSIIPKLPEITESERSQAKLQTEDMSQMGASLFQGSKVASFQRKNDDAFGFLTKRICSCCSVPFRMRSHAHRLLQAKSVGVDIAEPDVPALSFTPRDRLVCQDLFNKSNEFTMTPRVISHGNIGYDKLSYIGYKELKITSDTESEVPISDDDDGNTPIEKPSNDKEGIVSHPTQTDHPPVTGNMLSKTSLSDTTPEQLLQVDPVVPDMLLSVTEKHNAHKGNLSNFSLCKSNIAKSNGLEELNRVEVAGDRCPADASAICTEASNAKDDINISEAACPTSSTVEVFKASSSTETFLKPSDASNETVLPIPNVMDLNDSYKLVIVSKNKEPCPKDSSEVPEDLRSLLTQISQSLDSPHGDMIPSPRTYGLARQDSKISEGSGISVHASLTKRLSLERNESGFESSLDGSIFGEIDGEISIDKLKRHVELDRKSLSILYKELEEERSASAIAANQAMAMITRLQEEKASMQMEALHYQRMMEEQAEYDQEALQKQSDLLAEREKEIQDLEAELAVYKRKFVNDHGDEEEQALIIEEKGISRALTPCTKEFLVGPKTSESDTFLMNLNMRKSAIPRDSLLDFEEEKLYISNCLTELEEKLRSCSEIGPPECETKVCEFPPKDTYLHEEENNQIAGSVSSSRDNSDLSRENSHACAITNMNNHENGPLSSILGQQNKQHSELMTEINTVYIEHEISDLKNRLDSIEADRYFLEHMINSLHNGKEGLLFVQEIAKHLQELRKIRIR